MWSPILKVELLKEGRNIRLPILIIFYNAILAFVMILFMVFNTESFQEGYYYDTTSYLYQFLIISSIQMAAVFCLVPFYVSGMFAHDREKCVREQLPMIPGLNRQIVLAKMLLVLFINGLLYVSALPVISLSCLYSGISWLKIIRLGIMLLLFSFWAGAIAVFFYSFFARLRWAMAGTLITELAFGLGTLLLAELLRNAAVSGQETVPEEIRGICLFILLLNPLASYMGYYGNLTGDTGVMSMVCGRIGVNVTGKVFSLLFYKLASVFCVAVGVLFLLLAVRCMDGRRSVEREGPL